MNVPPSSDRNLHGLTLVALTGAWIAGILCASILPLSLPLCLLIIAMALCLLFSFWQDHHYRLAMLLLLFLSLGAWRYTLASPQSDLHAVAAFVGPQAVTLQGSVSDEPRQQGHSRVLTIRVSRISQNGGESWQDVHGDIAAQTPGEALEDPYGANYGDSVQLQGKLQSPSPHSALGIFAIMTFPRILVHSTGGNPLLIFLYHLRITLATQLTQTLPQPEAALLCAILLGVRTAALRPFLLAFNVTGTAHLVAPSGFKVTILMGLVARSSLWFSPQQRLVSSSLRAFHYFSRWHNVLTTGLILSSVGIYTVLSGAGPAALRAGSMGMLLTLAPRLGRTYSIYTALAASALVLSGLNPFILWDAGFLLSFLGTLGIVLLTPPLQSALSPLERLPLGFYVAETVAVTLAAQITTLPISALSFSTVSFIAPLANLLTVPLLGVLILLGVFTCCMTLLALAPVALLCGWVAWPLLWYVLTCVLWCANLPGASISIGEVDSRWAWLYYGCLALLMYILLKRRSPRPVSHQHASVLLPQRTWRWIQLGLALLAIFLTATSTLLYRPNTHILISFLSVGPAGQQPQGEAILIRTPDSKTILIDGGLDSTSLSEELNTRLPVWQHSLDQLILTSAQLDHLAALQDILHRYQIGGIIDAGMLHPTATYALWQRTIREQKFRYTPVKQGATLTIGALITVEVLWPTSELHRGSNEQRDNALILRLVTPGVRVLLLGTTAQSSYALTGLLQTVNRYSLHAEVVQVIGESGKMFPEELEQVLQYAQPSFLVVTPASLNAKERKRNQSFSAPSLGTLSHWRPLLTAQTGTLEVSSSTSGWTMEAITAATSLVTSPVKKDLT